MAIKQSSVFSNIRYEEEREVCRVPLSTVRSIIKDIYADIKVSEVEKKLTSDSINSIGAISTYVESLGLENDSGRNFNIVRIINAVASIAYGKTMGEGNKYRNDLQRGVEILYNVRNICQMDDREQDTKSMSAVMETLCRGYETYMLYTLVTTYPKYKYQ